MKQHLLWCRECGEVERVVWDEVSDKEIVHLEVLKAKARFEWHRVFCRTFIHLKEVGSFIKEVNCEN